MRFLLFFLRFIFSITFILSGIFKLADPIGASLIVKEYLTASSLDFLLPFSVIIAISLSLIEFLVGISIGLKIQIRISSLIGLIMTFFFTVITVLLVIFDPIQDCGCFGEAIHLTHTQTLIKNIILLLAISLIFIFRNSFKGSDVKFAGIPFLVLFGAAALYVSIHSLKKIPMVDAGDYKISSDIAVKLEEASKSVDFVTMFIYEKDGERKEFSLEELPDSTWTFIDSKDASNIPEKGAKALFDFAVKNSEGDYVTDEIVFSRIPIITIIVTDIDKFINDGLIENTCEVSDSVKAHGGSLKVLTSSSPDYISQLDIPESLEILYSDYKTLISMNRSNGGALYLYDALVIDKWASGDLTPQGAADVICDDPDAVMAKGIRRQQLSWELTIFAIILSILAVRYIHYSRKQS